MDDPDRLRMAMDLADRIVDLTADLHALVVSLQEKEEKRLARGALIVLDGGRSRSLAEIPESAGDVARLDRESQAD